LANVRRGEATIELNGHEYTIRLDFNALCTLEQNLGMPVTKLNDNMGLTAIREIIYIGLRHEFKPNNFNRTVAGEMIDPTKIDEYVEAITKALNGALGIKEDDDTDLGEAGTDLESS
jgi:hypothetical protein